MRNKNEKGLARRLKLAARQLNQVVKREAESVVPGSEERLCGIRRSAPGPNSAPKGRDEPAADSCSTGNNNGKLKFPAGKRKDSKTQILRR
jgi:hypothetical protein